MTSTPMVPTTMVHPSYKGYNIKCTLTNIMYWIGLLGVEETFIIMTTIVLTIPERLEFYINLYLSSLVLQ